MSLLLVACGSDEKEVVDIGITPGTKTITMGQQTTFAVATTNTDYSLSAPAGSGCVKTNATTVTCTPTAAGTYDFTVTATADKNKTKTATLVVNEVIITITPETATVDIKQSVPFTVDADFTLSADDAAGCVKTNATTVTCTPTASGEYEVTVTATADANKTKKATLVVKEVTIAITPETATVEVKKPVTFEVSTDFTVSADAAAGCVKTNSTTVTCTPTAKGEYPVTVVATADTSKTKTVILSVDAEEIAGMVFVEHGKFTMGCTSDINTDCNAADNLLLPHEVILTEDFYIGKYEVTRAQWKDVVTRTADSGHGLDADPSAVKEYPAGTENDSLPVTNVSWDDVQKFLIALNSLPENADTGRTYRLPTEAEWEYAARGGNQSQNYAYVGGTYDDAWYMDNAGGTPHPVGIKNSNELDVRDMAGNVREWCNDLYNVYDPAPQTNPPGPVTDNRGNPTRRVMRGGAFNDGMHTLKAWWRGFLGATASGNTIGFRLVLDVPTYETPTAEPTL
jgi:formylglycine-generating enzyme required for sulfatase activity